MFTPGLHELIVGNAAVGRFENIGLGSRIRLQDGPWTVVGIFKSSKETGGDYGIMADTETLLAALHHTNINIVTAVLKDGSTAGQAQFISALKSNPALSVDVEPEDSYTRARWSKARSRSTHFPEACGDEKAASWRLSAIIAALNTMYAAVSARLIEIATLRAIGFGATSVVISIIVEAARRSRSPARPPTRSVAWIAFSNPPPRYDGISQYHSGCDAVDARRRHCAGAVRRHHRRVVPGHPRRPPSRRYRVASTMNRNSPEIRIVPRRHSRACPGKPESRSWKTARKPALSAAYRVTSSGSQGQALGRRLGDRGATGDYPETKWAQLVAGSTILTAALTLCLSGCAVGPELSGRPARADDDSLYAAKRCRHRRSPPPSPAARAQSFPVRPAGAVRMVDTLWVCPAQCSGQ